MISAGTSTRICGAAEPLDRDSASRSNALYSMRIQVSLASLLASPLSVRHPMMIMLPGRLDVLTTGGLTLSGALASRRRKGDSLGWRME